MQERIEALERKLVPEVDPTMMKGRITDQREVIQNLAGRIVNLERSLLEIGVTTPTSPEFADLCERVSAIEEAAKT